MAINTTSSTKTPQAGDDTYSTTEDWLTDGNVLTLNVMSNDLGGNAKTLWSIAGDDGNAMNQEDLSALLAADPNSPVNWETTHYGNQIRIVNGQIEYKLGNADAVNALAEGEHMQDTFTYAIRLANGTLSLATVTVDIVGSNDAPSTPTDTNAAGNTIAEDVVNGALVGITANAIDVDSPAVTYSLFDDAGGRFTIDTNTGVVSVANASLINFEDNTSHTITVRASDGTLFTDQTFTINVTDVNPSTPTDTNAGGNTVAEGAANGSTVGITASSTDPNGPAVTYTLSDNAGGRFAIDSSTGVVTVADGTLLNYEDATSHSITVEASDGAGPTSSQTFTINVTDVVENAAPVANGDIVLTNVTLGNPILIPAFALLANDTDAENNTLSIGTVSNPAAGDTVAITSGDVTYTDQNPLDGSFQYTAFDGTSNSAAASVTVDTQTGTTITGTAANEILIGTAQADTLIGGQGNDILIGNAGNDTYVFSLNDGNDMILDATGANDKIQINGTPITSLNFLNDGSGNLVIDVNNTHVTVMGHYTGTGVEQIAFTSGGTVYGYSLGTATYNISTSASGSSGNTSDVVAGTSTANTIDGGGNNSSSGNDLLFGNAGNDVLTGQGQNDLLVGGAGNDSLTGGSGADVFAWKAGDQGTTITPASDTITDFDTTASSDKLTLSDLLLGESHTGTAAGNLANYLHFSVSSGTTTLQISTSGDFTGASDQGTGALTGGELAKVDQVITFTSTNLVGVNLTQDTIISSLFSAQKLLTD